MVVALITSFAWDGNDKLWLGAAAAYVAILGIVYTWVGREHAQSTMSAIVLSAILAVPVCGLGWLALLEGTNARKYLPLGVFILYMTGVQRAAAAVRSSRVTSAPVSLRANFVTAVALYFGAIVLFVMARAAA